MIANARAEALLATGEDQSEGRRRAVALNNMLFSAALSRHALEGAGAPRRELLLVDPGRRLRPAVRAAEHGRPATRARAPASSRCCATSPTCAAPPRRSRRTTAGCATTEAEVRAERDRLDLIIDSVADPILVTDPGGNIVDDERAGRAAVHRAPTPAARRRSASCRPTTRTSRRSSPTCSSRPTPARRRGEHQPGRSARPASRCPWRRSPARSSPSTARSPRWSPSCTTGPRSWSRRGSTRS